MLVECKNCGAPLSVKDDNARYVECGYCGKTNRLGSLKTLHTQTPVQWSPPPVWVQPGSATSLQYSGTRVKAVSAGIIASVVGVVLASIAGMVAVLIAIGVVSLGAAEIIDNPGIDNAGQIEAMTWDGTAPYACGGHDEVTLSNVTATLPEQTAISVSGHCELTLENVTITARLPLSVSQHGRVTVRGGRLEGSPNVIEALGHAVVEASGAEVVGEVTEERHAHVTR